jgi:hypothetical protein
MRQPRLRCGLELARYTVAITEAMDRLQSATTDTTTTIRMTARHMGITGRATLSVAYSLAPAPGTTATTDAVFMAVLDTAITVEDMATAADMLIAADMETADTVTGVVRATATQAVAIAAATRVVATMAVDSTVVAAVVFMAGEATAAVDRMAVGATAAATGN